VILLRVKGDAKRTRRYRAITAVRASDAVARSLKQPEALSPTSYSAIAYDVFGYALLRRVCAPCLAGMPASLKSLFHPPTLWLDWSTY